MKKPHHWLRWLIFLAVIFAAVPYVLVTQVPPRYIPRVFEKLIDNRMRVASARVTPQLAVELNAIQAKQNSSKAAFSIDQASLHLRQFWLSPKLIQLESVDIERPYIRFSRTDLGTLVWPQFKELPRVVQQLPASSRLERFVKWFQSNWKVQIQTIRIANGSIEFIDEKPSTPFHVALEHATIDFGPVSFPDNGEPVSFAVRGLLTGFEGRSAPAYCSGWIAFQSGDLSLSCQLEPISLAVFDAYFQEVPVIRVYSTTLASTSRWSSKAKQLDTQIHLEMNEFEEGDISYRGHTLFNIKKLAKEGERRLVADVNLSGLWDDISTWRGDFIPGNGAAQNLVGQLLEREVKTLRVPLGGHRVGLRVAPASDEAIQDAEATSKSVAEALELLAEPIVIEPQTPAAEPAPVDATGESAAPSSKEVVIQEAVP